MLSTPYGPVTHDRIARNMPDDLIMGLTTAQIQSVSRLVNAAYLDGYVAAGGDPTDTVTHREEYRQGLCERTSAVISGIDASKLRRREQVGRLASRKMMGAM